MTDSSAQFANQAQEAQRAILQTVQGGAGRQFNLVQRLGEIQQRLVQQAIEASNEQLQVLTQVRDPRAFADAQANLVKRHGHWYVEYIQQAVDVLAEAWQDYGDRLEGTLNTVTDKAQRATSSKRAA
jgi:phasin family protein